ncbi:cryptochrome/photolyase family protein [Devosia rhizoryzae]|uniref:Deoxyribodipyrimidine photo-lyase n=1 Tax=Devosia rhizoryzae TaxID=2774137 RepID=A0ABX7CCB5_9HYPH|nr:deoxyribodipyrimidine photo-lyase [Devosia rhizoryzae]QQR40839.1 deoxyribodipyrimidine photo-lyase [Devosia rhizoryzae]
MSKALVWLRNDLRLSDNPALVAAFKEADDVTAVFIFETDEGIRAPGGAARWWFNRSLTDLSERLAGIGVHLLVEKGKAETVLRRVLKDIGATSLHWNRRYHPAERALDSHIKERLGEEIAVESHPGNVLVEPWDIATGTGKSYSVYGPFWKNLRALDIAEPLPAPKGKAVRHKRVDENYREPKWAKKFAPYWTIGEIAAQDKLAAFFDERLTDYPQGRDFPALAATSHLSPHLRHGEISPRQIWHAAKAFAHAHHAQTERINKFLSELAWRDFNYHQLYHRDDIVRVAMHPKYEGMKWRDAPEQLEAWKRGRTGIPMVDAGMRELWETGYMENRVRMLTASFLCKNLLIDWRVGEEWFWDCLCDGDIANNPGNWQWVAGSGMDASPFFRIFNPVTQGERFDADGDYVRRWVPELSELPDKHVQQPWAAPKDVLAKAGVKVGETYPEPIVDLKETRERALEAAKAL